MISILIVFFVFLGMLVLFSFTSSSKEDVSVLQRERAEAVGQVELLREFLDQPEVGRDTTWSDMYYRSVFGEVK